MTNDLDDHVQAFLLCPIEQPVAYLFVDASYYKVREGVRYVTKAVLVVAGVREDGYREILGARITDGGNEGFWSGLFEDLKERGGTGVQLVISDGHMGIQEAALILNQMLPTCLLMSCKMETVLPGASDQPQRPQFIF